MLFETTAIIVGIRRLQDATALGVGALGAGAPALSYVAVPTYSADNADDKTNKGSGANVAVQTVPTPDGPREVVVIDSVQSQANRVERALKDLFCAHSKLPYPRVSIPLPDGYVLTNWDLSHRSADQILRLTDYFDDSSRTPQPGPAFMDPMSDLTYFLQHHTIDPVLGVWWAQTGPKLKLPRLLASNIMGYGPVMSASTNGTKMTGRMQRGAQKNDPLITGTAYVTSKAGKLEFDFNKKSTGDNRLSSFGLGDIPATVAPSNVFAVETVEQRVSLAIGQLRRAQFPGDDKKTTPERDAAGRAVLEALALIAFRAALEIDGLLRSGCNLVPVPGKTSILTIDRLGKSVPYDLPTMDKLVEGYAKATAHAKESCGFKFENVDAKPKPSLEELYKNRKKQMQEEAE